ncbi:MAG TPA: MBL fold metallo-hydrolase [Gaiellaceae bacterium]|nr:MBL fold metallo-hydrolase [Gaiellaceae bacterium]
MATGTDATSLVTVERFSASEPGAWSNAYLLSDGDDALLFDVFQLRSDAEKLAESIEASGKKLGMVWISHAHPDHFLGLDLIVDRFPGVEVLTTPNVLADLQADGPWMFDLLREKLGSEAAERLVEPAPVDDWSLRLGESIIDVVEFGPGECKHHACLHLPSRRAFVAADVIYNGAHLYLQEHNLEGWLTRLDELERFAAEHGVHTIYPGHGPAGGLSLIEATREYLKAFASAVETGNADSARATMMARFPDHRVPQFLTAFSLPAYFPPAAEE